MESRWLSYGGIFKKNSVATCKHDPAQNRNKEASTDVTREIVNAKSMEGLVPTVPEVGVH